MKKKDEEVKLGELIGLWLEVTHSDNKYSQDIRGKIIDETKNTITVLKSDGKKSKLIKKQNILKITKKKGTIIVSGKDLADRPEERTKKWLKKISKAQSR